MSGAAGLLGERDAPDSEAGPIRRERPEGIEPTGGLLLDLLAAGALLITTAILHLAMAGHIPSGGDGGNWLALARQMLGEPVMSAEVVYPPVFPGVLAVLLRALDPVEALLVAALVAEALLVLMAYACVRRAGRGPALVAGLLTLLIGYRLEAYAWGAYPQILAMGLGMLSVWMTVRFVTRGRWGTLAVALGASMATLFTHKLVGGLLPIAVAVGGAHALWREPSDRAQRRRLVWAVAALWACAAAFAPLWLAEGIAGAQSRLNPLALSRPEQLALAVREAPLPWVIAAVVGIGGSLVRSRTRLAPEAIATGSGWASAGLLGFLILGEPRALIQAQVGLVLLAVLVVWWWWRAWSQEGRVRRVSVVRLILVAAATAGSMAVTGAYRYAVATDWYRVVGEPELRTLSVLRAVSEPAALVVASQGPNGNPIGWWVEGYAGLPAFTAIDSRLLTFPQERSQAEVAAAVFADRSGAMLRSLGEVGVRFVVLDRRGPDRGWAPAEASPDVHRVAEGGGLVVFEVVGAKTP